MPNKLDKLVRFALLAPFVAAMVIHGSTKPPPGPRTGRITFDTRYITDTGSYLTNDTVHIALAKTSAIIPDSTPVLVHAREVGSTNAEDWVELSPRLTIAGFPHDYTLAGATNYDVDVMADYVPPAPVVTNDVLVVNALAAKDSTPPGPTLSAVLPRVALVTPIEYLESTGAQYLSIPINVYTNYTIIFDGYISSHNKELYSINANADNQFNYETGQGYYRWFSQARVFPPANKFGVRTLWRCSESLYMNGEYFGKTAINLPNLPTTPLYIFKGSHGEAAGCVWKVQVLDGNINLVFDGQPVRVGSTGAMLDRVSGRLFFNAGTGSFRLGPDLK